MQDSPCGFCPSPALNALPGAKRSAAAEDKEAKRPKRDKDKGKKANGSDA